MVSAARIQCLSPMRGFQSKSLALEVNSFALIGLLTTVGIVLFIIVTLHQPAAAPIESAA